MEEVVVSGEWVQVVYAVIAGLITILSTVLAILKQIQAMREKEVSGVLIRSIEEAGSSMLPVKRIVYEKSAKEGLKEAVAERVKEVLG